MKAAGVDESENIYHPIVDMGVLSGDPYNSGLIPEMALKYQAEEYENEIAYSVSQEADLVLVDGSLIARLADIGNRASERLRVEYMAYAGPLKWQ